MSDDTTSADLLAMLDALGCAIDSDVVLTEDSIAEQRRQAHATAMRRKRDATQYALGGTFMMLGFDEFDDTMIVGLLAHCDLFLRWLGEARRDHGRATFAELVGHVLSDPGRAEWCRAWGVYLRWERQKRLYDAEVTAFIASGRAGPKARWRRDAVSEAQAYLIDLICELKLIPQPGVSTKGEAFEWIYKIGGNPRHWAPPETPPWER